jgi:hypothetical protein
LSPGTLFVIISRMRVGALLILLACLAACASKPGTVATVPAPETHDYEPLTASALVFDPPIAANQPRLELSRDLRQPSAFVGYDGPITTYYWIHTDDWQNSAWSGDASSSVGDQYERRAVIDTAGVRYR